MTMIIFAILGKDLPADASIIMFQLAPTKDALGVILNKWGEKGIQQFINTMWLDFFFPVFYTLLISGFACTFSKNLKNKKWRVTRGFIAASFSAGLLDYLENVLELFIIINFPNIPASLVTFAFIVSLTKWILVLIAVIGIIVIFILSYSEER